MDWSTACLDWQDRIVARQSLIPPPLFPSEAAEALKVFKSLRIVDVPGRPTFGEACEPWVFEFVAAIFGAYNKETGARLISEFFLLISKKNAKSTIAAGIMVTALVRNWREEAELLLLAPTIEVAKNAWRPAVAMIRADPDLCDLLHIQNHRREVTHLKTKAVLKVIAAASETVSGKKAGFVFIDELWEFGTRADAGDMMIEATGGLASRPEGFVIYASTQSDREPAGVFKEKLSYHRGVRDGLVDDKSSLPVIYEFPPAMLASEAYLDPANWYVTNPNLGRSVDINYLLREKAKAFSPMAQAGKRQAYLAKHLNVEIGLRLSNDGWLGADFWEGNDDSGLTLDALIERSEVATIGIDGGGLDDLMGVAVIGREKITRRWLVWCHAFAHPKVLELRQDIASTLQDFAAEGSLTFTEVDEDVEALAAIVVKVRDAGLLPEKNGVGFDPNNISAIMEALAGHGIEGDVLRRLMQGSALAPAVNMLPRKLFDHSMVHTGSAMMNWCAGNAKVEMRGNAPMVTKQVSGRAKIDPLIALFCAAMLMSWNPAAHAVRSFWETMTDDQTV